MNLNNKVMAEKVCPIWVGYFLLNPLRKLGQSPKKILSEYVKPGMCVADIGSAMGYFSLPMARMLGNKGKVVCVDIQQDMLEKLEKRARKARLSGSIVTCKSNPDSLNLDQYHESIDFALVFAVLHEADDQKKFLSDIYNCLKPGCWLLLSEPKGHVSTSDFERSLAIAEEAGFYIEKRPLIARSISAVLKKERT